MLLSLLSKGYFSGIKIIKTETIEAIHEKDEGSMQNVGMSMTELRITTINYSPHYFTDFFPTFLDCDPSVSYNNNN